MRLHHLARITLIVRDLTEAISAHQGETDQSTLSQALLPEARALALGASVLAGARMAELVDVHNVTIELIEQPTAHPAAQQRGWVGFERGANASCLQVNCQDSSVSAAFYLGLGAAEVRQIDAHTRLIPLINSTIRFVTGETLRPAMDVANVRLGIMSVQIARLGSRGQAGPVRVLRGPDAEIIELV